MFGILRAVPTFWYLRSFLSYCLYLLSFLLVQNRFISALFPIPQPNKALKPTPILAGLSAFAGYVFLCGVA